MKHPKSFNTTKAVARRMGNLKLKGGKGETIIEKALWSRGIRYYKNYKKLPGSPDVAITKTKIAIFIDGEFWHGKDWEKKKKKLKKNREYWIEKIEENMKRDKKNDMLLKNMGWLPLHFWEKDVLNNLEYYVELIMYYNKYR